MKSKHYPAVTVFVAALLTILPALILSLSLNRNSEDAEITSSETEGDQFKVPRGEQSTDQPGSRLAHAAKVNETSNALTASATSSVDAQSKRPSSEIESIQTPQSLPEMVVSRPVIRNSVSDVPQPVDLIDLDMAQFEQTEPNVIADASQPDTIVADNGMIEMPTRPDTGSSYYEATGHLAMRTQSQTPDQSISPADPASQDTMPDATTEAATAETTAPTTDAASAASSKSSKAKKRKTKNGDDDVSHETVADVVNEVSRRAGANVPASKAKPLDDEFLEEVAIQTPLESAPVGRVENVMAMTRAKGWPIALIRSDLPDDVWWVQQVVGIQGNSFAARVNFGNEYTLSGSAFDMVIVFLDSPDEVRRFRIAKQFKELPEGVRHSREFHYIRN